MLNLDDEEIETLRLALEIAVQAAGDRMGLRTRADERCCHFCVKRFAALTERLIQYQKDIAEGEI